MNYIDLCHLQSSVLFAELWYKTELVTLTSAGSDIYIYK